MWPNPGINEASASSTPRLLPDPPTVAVEVAPPPLSAASNIAVTSCDSEETGGGAATGAPGMAAVADVPARRAAIALARATASACASAM